MTNYEWLKTISIEELAKFLCDCNNYCYGGSCDDCYQVKDNIEWLNKERHE